MPRDSPVCSSRFCPLYRLDFVSNGAAKERMTGPQFQILVGPENLHRARFMSAVSAQSLGHEASLEAIEVDLLLRRWRSALKDGRGAAGL